MSRTDTWRDWYREFHTGIPIPIKGQAEAILVTTTEVAVVDRVWDSLSLSDPPFFFSFNPRSPIGTPALLEQIKATIEKIAP